MVDIRKRFGNAGESLAAAHLQRQGYKILERNYRSKLGEIDIIARDNRTVVFIEVKTRGSKRFGHPKYAVTADKRRKISQVALYYLKTTRQSIAKARFDVVTIESSERGPHIEVIKNAFELSYA